MNMIPPNNLAASETLSEILDRLAILEGRIKMNTPEQALALLQGLDQASDRVQSLEDGSQSRLTAQVELDGIVARIQAQASDFIRDLGGVQSLRRARDAAQPQPEQSWWFLDTLVADGRRKALRRLLMISGVVLVLVVALGLIYQRFLAPDPRSVALYDSEQTASQALINGDLPGAMKQADQGLNTAPDDPRLLLLKGVVLEAQHNTADAEQSFSLAQKGMPNREEFLVTRGQYYAMANLPDAALADAAQAVQVNRFSAQGYLLMGQAHEMKTEYRKALDDYDLAYSAANQANQPELAAIARQHTAMLYQMMGAAASQTQTAATPTR